MYQRFDPIPVVNDLEISCIWAPGVMMLWENRGMKPDVSFVWFLSQLGSHSQFKLPKCTFQVAFFVAIVVAFSQFAYPFQLVHSQYGFIWNACFRKSSEKSSFFPSRCGTLGCCPFFRHTQASYCWTHIYIYTYLQYLHIYIYIDTCRYIQVYNFKSIKIPSYLNMSISVASEYPTSYDIPRFRIGSLGGWRFGGLFGSSSAQCFLEFSWKATRRY